MRNQRRLSYTREMLEPIISEAKCISDAMRLLGLSPNGGGHTHLTRAVRSLGLDTSHFLSRSEMARRGKPDRLTWVEILVNRRSAFGYRELASTLRRALIDFGREYKCQVCGLPPEWMGKPLVLQVDHLNGDGLDNRPENLRFICGNCHCQTPNYVGNGNARSLRECKGCGVPTAKRRIRCDNCPPEPYRGPRATKITWPSTEELEALIKAIPLTQVAKKLGVSDTAVRRRCKTLGIWPIQKG